MGRFVSRLESIPIYLFDLTATISSSRPKKRLALDGREHSGRLVGSRDLMLPITTIPRGARHQAQSIPIYLFDLTATISSSRPKKRLALDGREHSGRLVGSRDLMLPITTIPRGARHQARASRRKLVFGRSVRIATMMQSCASAAKLRGGGPILRRGSKTKSQVGLPPPQATVIRLMTWPASLASFRQRCRSCSSAS